MKKYLLFLIIIKLLNFSTNNLISNDALFAKGHVIHDLKLNVTWLRCSVGQVWNEKECVGKPLKFKISEVDPNLFWIEDKKKREKCLLFTEHQLEVAQDRASKNLEDIPKKGFWSNLFD